jgi:hypothetical protein
MAIRRSVLPLRPFLSIAIMLIWGKNKREKRGMTRPSPKDIKAIADAGGVPVDADVATRIANSIGPAFEGFEPVSGTLPFDLEPATFLMVQTGKTSS